MKDCWLKPDICFEPLIFNWYAWANLVSPMTSGAILNKQYLNILRSYLTHPELHQKACENPKLIGGPYVNLTGNKTIEVSNLCADILAKNDAVSKLAIAIDNLSGRLELEVGFSLESIYAEIAEPRIGCVELVYDMYHRANIRIIEPMIYRQYYNCTGQAILLSQIASDARPFVLSTPRIPAVKDMLLPIPFSDKVIDHLVQSRRTPYQLERLRDMLSISEQDQQKFANFFTNTPPDSIHTKYRENKLRIRYFGHACVLIETKHSAILIDPFINYHSKPDQNCFNYHDLPDNIDYVLITHAHQDHVNLETLLQIRQQIKTIVVPENNSGFLADPSLKLMLKHIGFESVISIKELEQIVLLDGVITGIPFLGEHGDLNIHSKLAYHLKIANKSILFAVDSNNIDNTLYKKLASLMSPVDMLFIGMECQGAPMSWSYGPLFTKQIQRDFDQSRRLSGSNCDKAWLMVRDLQCAEVVIYAMGQEPWLRHVMGLEYTADSPQLIEADKLLEKCRQSSINALKPFARAEWTY